MRERRLRGTCAGRRGRRRAAAPRPCPPLPLWELRRSGSRATLHKSASAGHTPTARPPTATPSPSSPQPSHQPQALQLPHAQTQHLLHSMSQTQTSAPTTHLPPSQILAHTDKSVVNYTSALETRYYRVQLSETANLEIRDSTVLGRKLLNLGHTGVGGAQN
jgi:hypothetical protein